MNEFDVIADSEGEELELGLPRARRRGVSSIETANTSFAGEQKLASSIVTATTSFGALLNSRWEENTAGGTRPRPRPIFRNKEKGEGEDPSSSSINTITVAPTAAAATDTNHDEVMDFPSILSIADRAKMRQRNTKLSSIPSSGQSTRIPHPFDEEDELYDSYNVPDVDEEHATKPKPKPKPKTKTRDQTNTSTSATTPALAGDTTGKERQPHEPTSQLSVAVATFPPPPSDLPVTSSSFYPLNPTIANDGHQEMDYYASGLPPIETSSPSSPSSLFSQFEEEQVEDAHTSTSVGGVRNNGPNPEVDPLLMGPPSSFFATPSSPTEQRSPSWRQQKEIPKQTEAREPVEVIDLCTVPPKSTDIRITGSIEGARHGKKTQDREKDEFGATKTKTNAKGKRKARDADDFRFDAEDDGDDDEYRGGTKRKKAKAKAKKLGGPPNKTRKTMEVVIDNPGRRSTKDAPDAHHVSKEPGGEGGGTSLPASDVLNRAGKLPFTPRGPALTGTEFEPPASAVPDSEGEDMQDLFQVDSYTMTASSKHVMYKPAPSLSKKRRKGVVYDDDEEGDNIGGNDGQVMSPKKKSKTKRGGTQNEQKKGQRGKGRRARGVVITDEEGDGKPDTSTAARKSPRKKKPTRVLSETEDEVGEVEDGSVKENIPPQSSGISSSSSKPKSSSSTKPSSPDTPNAGVDTKTVPDAKPIYTSLTSKYTIAPKTKSAPMSELIRRVNSMPLTPYSSSSPNNKPKNTKTASTPAPVKTQGIASYSPYLKTSRSLLSKIAPLHPNRRTPPPPPPPPPPRKKTKKELELEEKWEEELIESIGGAAAWSCLPQDERKEMRRVKWAVERGEIGD